MKKISIVICFSLIALSALSLGYAAWSQDLNIVGTVTPGTFSATINLDPDGLESSAEYATIEEGNSTDTSLNIVIDNAAAGNVFIVHYRIVNSGTIPSNIEFMAPVISATGDGASSSDITITTPESPVLLEGAFSYTGTLTITINSSTPMTGNPSYSITINISATPL